ncbi:hypothetical protein CsSME_00053837 [Camellia sinensis var. sinensis]
MAVLMSLHRKRNEESQKKKKATNQRVHASRTIMTQFIIAARVKKIKKQLENIKPCQGGHSVIFEFPSRL